MSLKSKAIIAVLVSLGLLAIYHAANYWLLFGGAGDPRSPTDGELLLSTLVLSLVALLQSLLLYRLVILPIRELDQRARFLGASEEVEEGTVLPESRAEELASLTNSFNSLLSTVQRLRQELQRSEARHNAYLDQSSEGIWRVMLDSPLSPNLLEREQIEQLSRCGRLVECNSIFARLTGSGDSVELQGRTLGELFADADFGGLSLPEAFVRSNYHLKNAEVRLDTADRRGHYLLGMTGLFEEGLLIGCWGTMLDITERKEHEDILRSSEKRFRTMADTAPVMIWLSDAERADVYFNKSWLDFTGRSLEQELADGWLAGLHPDDRELYFELSNAAISEHRDFKVEYRLRRHDGVYRWVVDHGTPCFSPEGSFTGYIGTCTDVTDQREMVHALRESEERYKQIYENAPVMIQSIDQQGLYVNVNEKWLEETGYSRGEVIGQPMEFVMTGDSARRALENTERFWKEGFLRDIPYQFRRRDGSLFDVLVNSVVTDDPAGGRVRLSVVSNVSERRRAEEELNRLATAVGQTAEGIIITDTQGTVQYVNPALQSITGYSTDEIIGNDPENLHLLGDDRVIYQRLKLNDHAERAWKGRFSIKRRDGTDCEGEATISPVRDHDGRIVNFVTVMRDVTKEIALQSKLQHADKAESLAVLAGGIAHDFNNLLLGIIGNASLALTEISAGSMAARRIHDIELAGQRAAELARQMLAYSGKGRFIMEVFDVSRLVAEMVGLMEVTISKNVKLNLNLATGLPRIEADATQIRQVVMNLLTNANEALQDRNGSITLSTSAEWCNREVLTAAYFDDDLPEAEYVIIEVADTGCGMDETTIKKVFDPFFTTKFTGHGLGMAAVLGIVRGHRGTIILNSTPGAGTTFRVLLPSSQQEAMLPIQDEKTLEDWRGSGTVLVVDDEDTVRSVVEQILEKAGFKVLLAVDGREGIDIFRERHSEITAVLLDMTMPNVNGQEAFKEMKRIREDALIIMSSGFNERETTYRIMGMGLGGFIQKPYRARDLILKLRELLEGGEYAEQNSSYADSGSTGGGQQEVR